MPIRPPRICSCGKVVASGVRCECQISGDRDRKARFDRTRPNARARGYTREWDKARAEYLSTNRTCRYCPAPANVVDHIKPHRGDMRLFWNRANWQPLCTRCHSSIKQSRERRI
ncbi:HNH endonuclease [Mesorhizobium sp.]|uniref:HNH endonuclease signature motif containing protein n=1 Tax=Mesorhizobium sp. TaxID=1871066 RepID=UPI000FE505F1|nr:HNH endonuclease [Mesorhizobium sp.]RWD80455.1 MAG: HNH endonuclease [Mesorhizobium sp.]TIS37409.1 MAG: HNH endonuclease [Mesorhizobium sp.]